MIRWTALAAAVLGAAALAGCGGGELSPAESVERYGVDEASSGVRPGACVDAQPESSRASTGAEVVGCGSPGAYAKVIARDPSRCGPGYVSASGELLSEAIVEGETVCIEGIEVDPQQVVQGLPGSPRYRCLAQAESAAQEMRCYQLPGE